jgi:hypothetical protein
MKLIALSDIVLESSTIAENLYLGVARTEWDATDAAAGDYDTNDIVYYSAVEPHMVYQSSEDNNTATPGTDAVKWVELGTTDRWAMFDDYINTYSADDEEITVEIASDNLNHVGLFGLTAKSVTLTQTINSGSTVVKTETINLDASAISGWYDYFFAAFEYRSGLVWEFPQYADATLEAEITWKPGEDAQCGVLRIGKAYDLGQTEYGVSLGVVDYSRTVTDDNGRTYFNPGENAKEINLSVWFYNGQIDTVMRTLHAQIGKLSIFDCNNDGTEYESFQILGKIEDAQVDIPGPTISRINITVQEVT